MKIKSIVPYYGGKRKMAAQIIEFLGPHKMYFEPFCGSLAVLLAKKPSLHETACELHGDIANLCNVLSSLDSAKELFERMAITPFSEELMERAHSFLEADKMPKQPNQHSVLRAYWFMVGNWMQRNGMAGLQRDCSIAARWTKGGGSPTTRWQSVIDSIPAWCVRLQNVVMLNRDAFDVIPNISDEPDTAIYCDPPYPLSTRGMGGGNRYLHDFDEHSDGLLEGDADDHERLAEMLHKFKRARIVVSTYDNEKYDRLYRGWKKIHCDVTKNMAQQNTRAKVKKAPKMAPEVLFVKGGK